MNKMRNIKQEINNLMNQIDQRKWHKQAFEDVNIEEQQRPLEPKIDSLTFSPGFIKKGLNDFKHE